MYTPLTEIERQKALSQQLRSTPYNSASPFSGLAHMLRQYSAGKYDSMASEATANNQKAQSADMDRLLSAISGGGMTPRTVYAGTESLGTIPGKRHRFETPEAQNMYAKLLLDQTQADRKAENDMLLAQIGGGTPYYSPVPTINGIGVFDHRKGQLEMQYGPDGNPYVRPQDDPALQGEIAGAEAGAAEDAKIDRLPTRGAIEAQNAAGERAAVLEAEYNAKTTNSRNGIGDIINEARTVLTGQNKPTSSGIGTAVDSAAALFGATPEGAAEADKLRAIGGALVSKMPRMEGPQSNFDVQNYREMAGQVGDSTIPIERRLAALEVVEALWAKYAHLNGDGMNKMIGAPTGVDDWNDI